MDTIYAYHITNKANIHSILQNGLVPSIGRNSRQINEHKLLTYFTTLDCVDTWIKGFKLDRNKIIILKFLCTNYEKRLDPSNDCFTYDKIESKNITVIDKEEASLKDYYLRNKEILDLEETKKIIESIKIVMDRLNEIESATLTPEEDWDYNETEPNIIETVELLKSISCLDDKKSYVDTITLIKEKTLKKLIANDLGINKNSAIYETLNMLFDDALSNNSKVDIMSMNYATIMLSINLLYRQLDRYNRTSKRYGDDNRIWDFDRIHIDDIKRIFYKNTHLYELLEETKLLNINSMKNYNR